MSERTKRGRGGREREREKPQMGEEQDSGKSARSVALKHIKRHVIDVK